MKVIEWVSLGILERRVDQHWGGVRKLNKGCVYSGWEQCITGKPGKSSRRSMPKSGRSVYGRLYYNWKDFETTLRPLKDIQSQQRPIYKIATSNLINSFCKVLKNYIKCKCRTTQAEKSVPLRCNAEPKEKSSSIRFQLSNTLLG